MRNTETIAGVTHARSYTFLARKAGTMEFTITWYNNIVKKYRLTVTN